MGTSCLQEGSANVQIFIQLGCDPPSSPPNALLLFRVITTWSQESHTDVAALNGVLGGTETKTDILVPAAGLTSLLGLGLALGVEEDVRLLLESALRLDGQLGRHDCGWCDRG